jgi:hypothetical protein
MPPHTVQDLQNDLDALKQDISNYIAARDAADVGLKQQVVDLTAAHVTDQAALDAMNTGIEAAFTKAEEARALIPAPGGGTLPPAALAASYADRATFDVAVGAYTGPEEVDVDGTAVKTGTTPALAYFTQADGSVSTTPVSAPTGPT